MNPRYTEVFKAHRLLFLAPVVIAAALAGFTAVTAPKMYQSDSTLWSDSPSSSSAVFGALPPAGQDQQLLNELLTTHYFQMSVAQTSPLLAYLRTHKDKSSGLGAVTGMLKGSASLNDRIAAALSAKRVTSVAKGPHVLEVSYSAPEPQLAVATLKAIIAQFRKQRAALRQDALQAAQKQVTSASDTLAKARANVTSYLQDHPSAGRSDPQLQELATAEREAADVLSNASDSMNQATQAVAAGESMQTVLKVIDAPGLPLAPTSGKKKLLMTVLLGAFAGAVISALGVLFLARRRPGAVEEETAPAEQPAPVPPAPATGQVADGVAAVSGGARGGRAARAQGRRLETVD